MIVLFDFLDEKYILMHFFSGNLIFIISSSK